jgi:hypothetical protein
MRCLRAWMNKLPSDTSQSDKEAGDPHQVVEFFDYLRESIERINGLCESVHDGQCRLFKKTLLFTFLDGLSTSVVDARQGGHQIGLRSFLVDYGDWEQGNRISLPHLCRWLEINPAAMTETGREIFRARLATWEDGEIRRTDEDPLFDDVCKFLGDSGPNLQQQLCNITHAGLLVHQRNCLVHEFMHNGVNLEFPDDESPYYMLLKSFTKSFGTKDGGPGVWQLFYPSGFLFWLARRCLMNLESYLLEHRVDPRESYSLGSYLWPRLNMTTSSPPVCTRGLKALEQL